MIFMNKKKLSIIIILTLLLILCNPVKTKSIDNQNSKSSEAYIYINDVTPVINLNDLICKVNYLNDKGIKFFLEVTPVFKNEESEAMFKFTECLRYVQFKGGRIVLSNPIINNKNSVKDNEIIKNEERGFENYINFLVYPVALSLDSSVLDNYIIMNLYDCTDTVFLNDNNLQNDKDKNIIKKISFEDYNEIKDEKQGKYAICINGNENIKSFKEQINKLMKNNVELSVSHNVNCSLKMGNNEIVSENRELYLNGNNVTVNNFIDNEEYRNYIKINENKDKNSDIRADLSTSNRVIELFCLITLLVFIVIILLSRKIERKKFFK